MIETAGIINDILGFVGAIVWAGAIILIFAAWIGKIWADIWFQKERELYQDEIEGYKALIEEYIGMLRDTPASKTHPQISQSKFNTEFVLYQNLSESGLELVESVTWLFPVVDELPRDDYERKTILLERLDHAQKKYNNYMRKLGQAAPFINKNIYYLFDRLRKEAHHQILFFPDVRIRKDGDTIKAKSTDCYANTDIIAEHFQETMESLRSYISSQKISENEGFS